MNETIIILDSSFLIHYFKFSMKDLSTGEKQTGIIYAYLKKILELSNKFKTNKFVFALDSRKSKRREIYPDYKKKRTEDQTEEDRLLNILAFAQSDDLMDNILPSLGFKNFIKLIGFEADDIIAQSLNKKYKFIVVSLDNDLYQLLDDNVSMYDIGKKKLFTKNDFIQKYGIMPKQWYDVKCLVGCKGDNVEGIVGVAAPTAIKYITGRMKPHLKTFQNIETWKAKQEFVKDSVPDVVARVVKTPFENTPDVTLDFDECFNLDNFMKICDNYRLRSFITGNEFDVFKSNFVKGGG